MHQNQIWLAFLATAALVAVWFTAVTGYELYTWYSLSGKTHPLAIEWSTTGKTSDRFYLSAAYSFKVKGDIHTGQTAFDNRTYRNTIAAEKALQEHKEQSWTVWYAPRNAEISTLNKTFPLKSCIYTAVLWGLLLYFVWLGFYVGKLKAQSLSRE